MIRVNREKIEAAPLIESIFDGCKEAIEKKKIIFKKEIAKDTGEMWVDKKKMEEAVRCLFLHALGNIQPNGQLTVRLFGTDKYVRFEIEGEDAGDFKGKMRRIFDFFGDIKTENEEHVGMWISLLKDIIELHKGKIWIEDESGPTSKCILVFPRDFRKKVKIVIADDNPDIRQTLKDILLEKEYEVDTVNNGYELIAYLKENNPKVVILDLMMPEKDGTEVFNTIKSIQSGLKIIIYTGFHRYQNSIFAHSAEKFLLKDENPEKLIQAIEEMV